MRLRRGYRFTTPAYASGGFGGYVSNLNRPYTTTQRVLGGSGLWLELDPQAGIVAREDALIGR